MEESPGGKSWSACENHPCPSQQEEDDQQMLEFVGKASAQAYRRIWRLVIAMAVVVAIGVALRFAGY